MLLSATGIVREICSAGAAGPRLAIQSAHAHMILGVIAAQKKDWNVSRPAFPHGG